MPDDLWSNPVPPEECNIDRYDVVNFEVVHVYRDHDGFGSNTPLSPFEVADQLNSLTKELAELQKDLREE